MVNTNGVRYVREGKGTCKICANERDLCFEVKRRGQLPGGQVVGMEAWRESRGPLLVSRHLNRIEEYTPLGASPRGFCLGSLQEPAQVTVIEGRAKTR